jgi:quercetin dioxygenase-like cupin family protein
MAVEQELPTILHRVDGQSHGVVLDVLGPTIEVLSRPAPGDGGFYVLRGVLPPGVTIPLHSNDDPEDFYLLAGSHQVLTQQGAGLQWIDAHAGDYVCIPPGTMHAHRNVSSEPGAAPHLAKAIDLTMLAMLTGRERTATEYERLLAAAGRTIDWIVPSTTPSSFIEATVG